MTSFGPSEYDDGDELEDDPEGPLACDLDEDDGETPTDDCPSCGREIAHDAQQCPYCHEWITAGARSRRRGVGIVVVAVLLIVAILLWLL